MEAYVNNIFSNHIQALITMSQLEDEKLKMNLKEKVDALFEGLTKEIES
jgi:hypothetical protein